MEQSKNKTLSYEIKSTRNGIKYVYVSSHLLGTKKAVEDSTNLILLLKELNEQSHNPVHFLGDYRNVTIHKEINIQDTKGTLDVIKEIYTQPHPETGTSVSPYYVIVSNQVKIQTVIFVNLIVVMSELITGVKVKYFNSLKKAEDFLNSL